MPSEMDSKLCEETNDNDQSLDLTFDKMEKLGIPADIFGNIHPQWRIVMRNYYSQDKQIDSQV